MNNVWRFKMKMVKSLLLGSATALVAIAGAQAADLPVKAKPVQYVKICSLYGAGFYYIPGTDECIKLGGFVRAEYDYYSGGSFIPLTANDYTRASGQNSFRARAALTADVRKQTEFGTLRSYLMIGETATNGNASAGVQTYMPRAFIQFAGFTAGLTKSFYDDFSFAAYSNQTNRLGSDTSGNGQIVFAYTAQFGNGLSASISIEDPTAQRQSAIYTNNTAGTALATGALASNNGWPDIVGNLHVDQSWGSAQIMGAIHDVRASYYNSSGTGTAALLTGNGHPSDEVGWAIGGGLKFNLPMLGQGDNVHVQADYAKGATTYTQVSGFLPYDGTTAARGYMTDAVFSSVSGGLTGLELTESWDVVGGYVHHWNSQWNTTLYGGYAEVNYSGSANAILSTALGFPAGSSADYSWWQVGSRTVWSPVKNLDLSVDVLYTSYNTGFGGLAAPACGSCSPGVYTYGDVDYWQAIFRWQRNFYP
jgi:hypothetical protein